MLVDPLVQSRTLMWFRVRGQASGHSAPAPPEPASEPAEQPSHVAWHSGNTVGFPVRGTRPARDQEPHRRVPAQATDAPEVGRAGAARSEVPDERRKVREMCGWDLCGGRKVLEAVQREGPQRAISEGLSNPSLLGTGEHGAAIVAEERLRGLGASAPPPHLHLHGLDLEGPCPRRGRGLRSRC